MVVSVKSYAEIPLHPAHRHPDAEQESQRRSPPPVFTALRLLLDVHVLASADLDRLPAAALGPRSAARRRRAEAAVPDATRDERYDVGTIWEQVADEAQPIVRVTALCRAGEGWMELRCSPDLTLHLFLSCSV